MAKLRKPTLDMHPLADLAFLLVTFFLLATVMKPQRPVVVEKPASRAQEKMMERNRITITVSEEGDVFFGVTGKEKRKRLIQEVAGSRNIELSQSAVDQFALVESFGIPIRRLDPFFSKEQRQRNDIRQPGIPMDSANTELRTWLLTAKEINPDYQIALEGDAGVSFGKVRRIIDLLVENDYTKFNLVTEIQNPSENE